MSSMNWFAGLCNILLLRQIDIWIFSVLICRDLHRCRLYHSRYNTGREKMKTMKLMTLMATLATGIILSGCAVVQSDKAIGEKAVPVNAADWDGVWTFNGGAVNAAVVDKDKGLLEIALVERKDGKFEMKTYRICIMQQDDAIIANLEDSNEKGKFSFGRISINPDEIILWIPNFAKFKELVQRNKLPGIIAGENKILLENLKAEHMKMIAAVYDDSIFSMKNPIVLKRSVKIKYSEK